MCQKVIYIFFSKLNLNLITFNLDSLEVHASVSINQIRVIIAIIAYKQ